jgi:signal peptidase
MAVWLQVVVVLSGSMEPAFYRGDILFLNKGSAPFRTGEIVVFNIEGRDIPIVHRIIKFHERRPGGNIDILTKAIPSLFRPLDLKLCD